MSIHVPCADEAQLTEVITDTNIVASLRECVRIYRALPADARANALILSDSPVPLPGRAPTKILEHTELEALIASFGRDHIGAPDIADLIERRRSS